MFELVFCNHMVRNLFRCVFVTAFLLINAACSQHIKEYKAIYWPAPPDPPRYVYEGTLRTVDDINAFTNTASVKAVVTGLGIGNQPAFLKPYDVAARGGKIVVSDTVSHSVTMWDIPRRKVFAFGKRGDGIIKKPAGVAMDGQQWVYVADVGSNAVRVYDQLGMFLRQIGTEADYGRPVDVAANEAGDRIYVVDAGGIEASAHRIVVFDAEGNKLNEIGTRGGALGDFNLPIQAAVAPDGTLYVLDSGNFRVQAFDADGNFLHSWGKVGRNFGDFARPRGIAVDADGNVYVTDAAYRNFQIFNPQGQLLMAIGGSGFDDQPGQFALPAGIAVDATGYVYVVDQILAKIDIIRKLSQQEFEAKGGKAFTQKEPVTATQDAANKKAIKQTLEAPTEKSVEDAGQTVN